MNDKDTKMILYGVGGAAAVYFLYKIISSSSGGDNSSGGDKKQLIAEPTASRPEGVPEGGVQDLAALFKTSLDKPAVQARMADNRESSPIVTSFGRQLVSPAPPTSAPQISKHRGQTIQAHLNWFFGELAKAGADTKGLPKITVNGEVDANTLKAFWVWFNTIWCARHLAGDEVLLGIAKQPAKLVPGYYGTMRKIKYTYVPTADKIGRGTPADYAIYNLFSRNDSNLTGAFSDKAIDNVMYAFKGGLTPHDLKLLKLGYDAYLDNPTYDPKGKWWQISSMIDVYPNPYPWPQ